MLQVFFSCFSRKQKGGGFNSGKNLIGVELVYHIICICWISSFVSDKNQTFIVWQTTYTEFTILKIKVPSARFCKIFTTTGSVINMSLLCYVPWSFSLLYFITFFLLKHIFMHKNHFSVFFYLSPKPILSQNGSVLTDVGKHGLGLNLFGLNRYGREITQTGSDWNRD